MFLTLNPSAGSPSGRRPKSLWREYAEAIFLAVVLALFILLFVVQAFKIPSGSMLPTLQIGDHILVLKFIYGVRLPYWNKVLIPIKTPQRDDVVVFIFPVDPSKDFIKRVVAIPGDKLEIRNRRLFVNDQPAMDEHGYWGDPDLHPIRLKPRDDMEPLVVPEGKLFVMGDNRLSSHDSRFWGFVDQSAVKGKAFLVYWSWEDGWSVRWSRLGSLIQ